MATFKREEFGSWGWLMREVGQYLGLPPDIRTWNARQLGKVDSIVQSGVMQFYNPEPLSLDGEGSPPSAYGWSFLAPVKTLRIESGVREYALDDDYGGIVGDLTVQGDQG